MMEYEYEIDPRGLQGKPGSVVLKKDKQNLIGISIGGGAPLCPCLYVVQVFDNTPASREGVLQAGDEIVGVNGKSLRGKTKVDVARAIQAVKDEVTINYVKLHAEPTEGKTLDISEYRIKLSTICLNFQNFLKFSHLSGCIPQDFHTKDTCMPRLF